MRAISSNSLSFISCEDTFAGQPLSWQQQFKPIRCEPYE